MFVKCTRSGFGGFDIFTEKDNFGQEKKEKTEKAVKKGCFVTEFGLKKIAVYITLFIEWNRRTISVCSVLKTA